MSGTPRYVPIAAGAGVAGLLLTAVLAWQVLQGADAEERRDCERAVAGRDDNRAMWLYLLGATNPDDQTVKERARRDAFERELNDRLPPLKCVDGNPTPDRDTP